MQLGNNIYNLRKEKDDSIRNLKYIYIGLAILCGSIAGIWSFSANRFRHDEMLLIIGIGIVIGVCLGVVCHNILRYIKE